MRVSYKIESWKIVLPIFASNERNIATNISAWQGLKKWHLRLFKCNGDDLIYNSWWSDTRMTLNDVIMTSDWTQAKWESTHNVCFIMWVAVVTLFHYVSCHGNVCFIMWVFMVTFLFHYVRCLYNIRFTLWVHAVTSVSQLGVTALIVHNVMYLSDRYLVRRPVHLMFLVWRCQVTLSLALVEGFSFSHGELVGHLQRPNKWHGTSDSSGHIVHLYLMAG